MPALAPPLPAEPLPSDRQCARELLHVAVPLILSAGSLSLMNLVDRLLVSWLAPEALAASLPAGMLHWTMMSLFIGTAMYVNTFVAQYEGAGRPDRVAASIWQGIRFAALSALVMAPCVLFSDVLFALVGHDPLVQEYEAAYFQVLACGGLPFMLSAVLSTFWSGRGRTRTVLAVHVVSVLVNGVLDWCLIFGVGPFPWMGIAGAALATVIAKTLECAIFAWLLFGPSADPRYPMRAARTFDRELFARMLRYGLPNGVNAFVDIFAFTVFVALVGRIGPDELWANNLAFALNSLAFIPMLGLGTAVSTLVGRRIGEGRPDRAAQTTRLAFLLSSLYMGAWIAVYLLVPETVMSPFSLKGDAGQFERMRSVVVVLLRFVAVYSFFDAVAIVYGAAVRGAGDTRFPMVFSLLSAWLVMVLPTWIAVEREHPQAFWIGWIACSAYVFVAGGGLLWRYLAGPWRTMRVIESFAAPASAPALPPRPASASEPVCPSEPVGAGPAA